MKKLLILFALAFGSLSAQTVTPTIGAPTQSIAAMTYNLLYNGGISVISTPAGGSLTASTPTLATAGSYTVAAGVRAITFHSLSGFVGSINGVSVSYPYDMKWPSISSYTYAAIPYTVTTGSVYVIPTR